MDMEENFKEKLNFYNSLFDVTDVLLDDEKIEELFLEKEKENLDFFFLEMSDLEDLRDYAEKMTDAIEQYKNEILGKD